jgi:dTDP-4-amino-4,6-dideoxygalactose transaminase
MVNKLALFGGEPVRRRPFPTQNTIGEEEKHAVIEVLDSGVLSQFVAVYGPYFLGGPRVRKLEDEFAGRFKAKYAIGTNSATTALHAAVAAAGIGPGDEVIVSPYTMSASATSILMQQAIPVFADVQDDTFCLDPSSVRKRITPYTRAILVTHLFGHPANMKQLLEIAREYDLRLIEDAAQAVGATYEGKCAGAIGDAGIMSLNFHKIIHTGEGGVVLTNDEDIANRVRLVRNHGETSVEDMKLENIANTMGSNYRMTEIEAAIGVEQLHKLDALLEHRNRLAGYLTNQLTKLGKPVKPPVIYPNVTHSFYDYVVRLDERELGISRHTFAEALRAEGVTFNEGYVKPLYMLPLFQKKIAYGKDGCPWTCNHYRGNVSYDKGICPVTERLFEHELLWGDVCHSALTTEDMDDVADAFRKVMDNIPELEGWEKTLFRQLSSPETSG